MNSRLTRGKDIFVSIFSNIISALRRRSLTSEIAVLTVRTTPAISKLIKPIIERLVQADKMGETYRSVVGVWGRWNAPPLVVYQGGASLFCVFGPLLQDGDSYRPSGGQVEIKGVTLRLSANMALDLDSRLKRVIETTIQDWVNATTGDHLKHSSPSDGSGAGDA